MVIYRKAIERMDSYVSFRDGRYELSNVTAAKLAISEELFAELQAAMQKSNDMLNEFPKEYRRVEIKPNVVRIVDPGKKVALTFLGTRGLEENRLPPNSDGWDARWYGVDIYLSASTLRDIKHAGNTGSALTIVVGAITGAGALITGLIAGAEALAAALVDWALGDCPNGVIVPCTWVGGVLVWNISCQ